MLNLCYVYYLSKLTEFMDTIFFVCRKKKSQITWLHLYHHSLTPLEAWILVKFIAGKIFCVIYFRSVGRYTHSHIVVTQVATQLSRI